eukprot:TRINITY_DN2593_c0_g2_i2.p1 TRINITY_DN2593_c0_g2~~TRINITY_DN2593_c0_g2_i2.p1  ORF type:complete len:546 (-),score=82.91 TRINITY_DN2593_c0_g2_i2:5112-6749(-)
MQMVTQHETSGQSPFLNTKLCYVHILVTIWCLHVFKVTPPKLDNALLSHHVLLRIASAVLSTNTDSTFKQLQIFKMSNLYTPSAESLKLFDEIRQELQHKRYMALQSLRMVHCDKSTNSDAAKVEGHEVKQTKSVTAVSWWDLLRRPNTKEEAAIFSHKTANQRENETQSGFSAEACLTTKTLSNRFGEATTCEGKLNCGSIKQGASHSPSFFHVETSNESLAAYDALKKEEHSRRVSAPEPLRKTKCASFFADQHRTAKGKKKLQGISWWDGLKPTTQKRLKNAKATNMSSIKPVESKSGFLPSEESLAVFDSLMGEVASRRSAAIQSLSNSKRSSCETSQNGCLEKKKSDEVTVNTFPVANRSSGFNGGEIGGKKCEWKSVERIGMKTMRYDDGVGTRWTTLWPQGKYRLVECTNPPTKRQAEAQEWCERVKKYQQQLRGSPPESFELWDRVHIPHQLRSTRPSAASRAAMGWEVNVDTVAERRRRIHHSRRFKAMRNAWGWMCSKAAVVKKMVWHRLVLWLKVLGGGFCALQAVGIRAGHIV